MKYKISFDYYIQLSIGVRYIIVDVTSGQSGTVWRQAGESDA